MMVTAEIEKMIHASAADSIYSEILTKEISETFKVLKPARLNSKNPKPLARTPQPQSQIPKLYDPYIGLNLDSVNLKPGNAEPRHGASSYC